MGSSTRERNEVDSANRSLLFVAVEENKLEAANHLIAFGAELDTVSGNKTALGIAAMKSGSTRGTAPFAHQMLEKGASPKAGMNQEVFSLLCASAAGDFSKVEALLKNNTKDSSSFSLVNGTDQLGHTALHVAACFGRYEVASLLIASGAKTDAEVALGGQGAIHMTVLERPLCLYLDADHQSHLPKYQQLTQDHATTMNLLLEHNASLRHKRDGNAYTVEALISERVQDSRGLNTFEMSIFQQMLMILEYHSHKTEENDDAVLHGGGDVQLDFSRIKIQHYTPNGERPIPGDKRLRTLMESLQESSQNFENGSWRWIHLFENVSQTAHLCR
ncbi:hypothetical protein CkaCkLH20_11803 [Colletotrichum karsti]|uniref:Ankyrin repeat protein n=1 Tax=Colletotrichum karsti TaxID=1095194 RepID=A0A9P6HX89_9PEZI|nr:uncharacterized protein CkaCkLH20_11803 [Colletotrichum karsti]KAF9870701.1 hypothetical protein CkaCkLH20_11803 [Colletotrichum karsti]